MKKNKKIMASYLFFLEIIVLTGVFYSMVSDEKNLDLWIGRYYTETCPHYENGPDYYNSHMITIFKHKKKYYALVEGRGKGLSSNIFAHVTGNNHAVNIYFLQTLPGDLMYGQNTYRQNELLLRLENDDVGILTEWGTLRREHPFLCERTDKIIGRYFERED